MRWRPNSVGWLSVPMLWLAGIGCGGTTEGGTGSGGNGGTEADASGGASGGVGGSGGSDAGGNAGASGSEGKCAASDFELCGVPGCNDECTCGPIAAPLGLCLKGVNEGAKAGWVSGCRWVRDGGVCIDVSESQGVFGLDGGGAGSWFSFPYDFGALAAARGAADRIRFADLEPFSGEPLPAPTQCPQVADLPLCGGNCAGCQVGEVCRGRSPAHPYGLCVDDGLKCSRGDASGCPAGFGCFTFLGTPEAQALADQLGSCVPEATCLAAAQSYPGGAACTL